MDAVPVWVVLTVLGCIGALAAMLWMGSDRKHDSAASKLDDHEKRLTRTEARLEEVEKKTDKFGNARHDILDDVSHSLSQWYLDIIKMIKKDGADK